MTTGVAVSHRRVLAIALPIVLSNATIPLLGAVDTAVVGQLGLAAPIGAVGLGAVILASIYWVFGFLRNGCSASSGIAVRLRPESLFGIARKSHSRHLALESQGFA